MAPLATFSTFSAPCLIFPPLSLSFSPPSLSMGGTRVKTKSRFSLKLSVHCKKQEEEKMIDNAKLIDEAIAVFDTCHDLAETGEWELDDIAEVMGRWFMTKDKIKTKDLLEMTEEDFVDAVVKRFPLL